MRVVAVTGTNTSVGKTVAVAALTACALAAGRTVAVVKPVQTGVPPGGPGDLDDVARLTGATDLHEYARFGEPLAPGTAARRLGVPGPRISWLAEQIAAIPAHDLMLIEGAGGPLVEFNAAGETLVDLLRALGRTVPVEVLLVASAGLGVLNLAALTARALSCADLPLAGVVVGDWPADPDLAARCNLADLPRYAGADLAGVVPAGSGRLDRAQFAAVARQSLAPCFDGNFDASAFARSAAGQESAAR
ncbi:MAG TPA: dethiobiotin synthase [Streptosporangiaceae bacterium]|nr:dethiobiotin synthase [Streptosporangiaceae bacterium]